MVVKPFLLALEGVGRLMKAIIKVAVLRIRPFPLLEKLTVMFTSPEREMLALLHPDIGRHLSSTKTIGVEPLKTVTTTQRGTLKETSMKL